MPDVTIRIEVVETGNGSDETRDGTFKQPWPLLRVKAGTRVRFQTIPANRAFTVTFPNGSPFVDAGGNPVTEIHDSDWRSAANIGGFHYMVSLFDGTNIWPINRCPEMDVGN